MKFVTGMMFAAHWVRRCWCAVLLRRLVPRYNGSPTAQIACIWRLVVDIEGDSTNPEIVSWITGGVLLLLRACLLLACLLRLWACLPTFTVAFL